MFHVWGPRLEILSLWSGSTRSQLRQRRSHLELRELAAALQSSMKSRQAVEVKIAQGHHGILHRSDVDLQRLRRVQALGRGAYRDRHGVVRTRLYVKSDAPAFEMNRALSDE